MKLKEFKTNAVEVVREFRAVCYSKNRHWLGTWKTSYSEAYNEAVAHRNSNPGNKSHDIKIIERVYSEAAIE